METDRVVSKSEKIERVATLLYKTWRGAAQLDDRMDLQDIVLTCDGPTYAEAEALAHEMREYDLRPARFAHSERFAA